MIMICGVESERNFLSGVRWSQVEGALAGLLVMALLLEGSPGLQEHTCQLDPFARAQVPHIDLQLACPSQLAE